MISGKEALARLRDGNRRFASNVRSVETLLSFVQRAKLTERQRPFAAILGCSDSRVPAEIVFDQGLGDLFVIRVAGNIVAPSQIGSIEYAASQLDVRLVVVLGHSYCGAVQATLEEIQRPSENPSRNICSIINRIRPSVEPILQLDPHLEGKPLLRKAVRENVSAAVKHLQSGSPLLEQLVQRDGLVIVGAEYSLETGLVDFFDSPLDVDQ